MKSSGKCPKCSSLDVLTNAERMKQGHRSFIGITLWSTIQVETYICMHCGFVEEYVDNASMKNSSKIEKLKGKWKKR